MKKNNWITIFTSIFLFFILGLLYDSQTVRHIDHSSFKFFEMIRTDALDSFCLFLRDFGSSKMYLTIAVIILIYSIFRKKAWTGISLIITLLTARVVVNVLKGIYERPRPTSMYYVEHGFSFPSGHAVMATCFFLTVCFILIVLDVRLIKQKRILEITAILIILLISFSRVYLHVHHLSDIIAGWFVGYAWYSICKNTFIFLHEKRQI
ncbi:phosphatase PAP2 family protein [Bacillus sp. EAC]|uniref:phosphatase PAP2 family protein n=1 Tax=Bacillus sp. EAC TaxID=1978338 RepID=UPI000B436DBC|nr:phosphatase PAP2 family protein [Bacillus sp. EAC]